MSEFEYTIADEINSEEGNSEEGKEDSVIVIEDDENDEMEGVENENAAADAERERRYREYMNESFNNFTMNNSFVGESQRSREESEFDEIHEFINEVFLLLSSNSRIFFQAGMNASISRIVDGIAVAWTMTIHFPRRQKGGGFKI